MPDETSSTTEVSEKTDSSKNRIYSLDSFSTRFIPPAAIGIAWWLSGIDLIEMSERGKDWKILAVAFAVFWLAACGSRLVALRPRKAISVAGALVLAGLFSGCLASRCDSYLGHVFYGATHALSIASLGLFIFVGMARQTPDGIKRRCGSRLPPQAEPVAQDG